MAKFEAFLTKTGLLARALLKVLPTRILLAIIGSFLAGVSKTHPDWPMPTAEELLIIFGTLVAVDTVRPIGQTPPAQLDVARKLSEALGAGKPKDSMEGK